MAKIYYRKIVAPNSTFTIEDVPPRWRGEVYQLLNGGNV